MRDVDTVGEAKAFLRERVDLQREQAEASGTPPNESIRGDDAVRRAFWALLSPDDQRALFLELIRDRRVWPRLRSLVGLPPYSFLRPEDEGVLRATGIAGKRVNMAHSEVAATNYNEFTAAAHLEDMAGRVYRVIAKERANKTELPWRGLRGLRVVADVRVQKTSLKRKLGIARGDKGVAAQAGLTFPRPGDTLRLKVVTKLEKSESHDADDVLNARVESGRQKEQGSPVARLVLKFE
jgi:hypothetical protein